MKHLRRPRPRTLAIAAAVLAVVVTAGAIGRVSAPDPAPTPAPVAAAAPTPASAVQASVVCDLYGPAFVVTIPAGQNPVNLAPGETIPGRNGADYFGLFDFAPSTGATTARFQLAHLTGTAFVHVHGTSPTLDVPYDCPPLADHPAGAGR